MINVKAHRRGKSIIKAHKRITKNTPTLRRAGEVIAAKYAVGQALLGGQRRRITRFGDSKIGIKMYRRQFKLADKELGYRHKK